MKTINKTLTTLSIVIGLSSVIQATCSTDIDMGDNKITNVSDPVNDRDVVNKQFMISYMQETLYETIKNRFIRDSTKEVVLDVSTFLIWQDNIAAETVKKKWLNDDNYNECSSMLSNCTNTAGDTAASYCSAMTLGGYTDWRMPTKEELLGIVKNSTSNPAISGFFQHVASSNYWSSTNPIADMYAEGVSFSQGSEYSAFKAFNYNIRCVREEE
jgi:hypothetical protein